MTHVAFDQVSTVADGDNMFLTGVTDMVVAQTAQGPVLYTVSRLGGGDLLAFRIGAGGTLTQIDAQGLPGNTGAGITNSLTLVDDGAGGQSLLVTGVNGAGLYRVSLDGQGGMSSPAAVTGAPLPTTLLASVAAQVNGQDYVYTIARGSEGIGVWSLNGDGSLGTVQTGGTADAGTVGLTGLVQVEVNGTAFLLAASGSDHGLISYRLTGNGTPQEVDRISAADEVGIGDASAVSVVTVGGQTYAILAASGSGTLSVAAVGDDGSLSLTDHVMDTLNTRFGGAHVLETVTHGDRAYVAVAGSDDGVTLFEMLPGGRLRHMGTVADAVETTLDAVSALSLTVQGNALHLGVTSSSEAGLSLFTFDLGGMTSPLMGTAGAETLTGGSGDDLILGGAGADRLRGEAGDDVIVDGTGEDEMWGGAGADVFMLSRDDVRDTIRDFDITEDSIDLSDWAFFRYGSQLTFEGLSDGITLRFGNEELAIRTANGQALDAGDILALDLVGQSRFLPSWFQPVETDPEPEPDPALDLIGTSARDTLMGEIGNDTLTGLEQDDELWGMAGADTLNGNDGDDTLDGGGGRDLLRGGIGNDVINGGAGHDLIYGEEHDDTLFGLGGNDLMYGDDGADVLNGNNGADTLYGGEGRDTLNGGLAQDELWGGGGNDVLLGRSGSDVLWGEAGNDLLTGDAGADLLDGGNNNDTLNGGIKADTLIGGAGKDRLNGENGADSLDGGTGDDTLLGGIGHDTLQGGAGDDRLLGGAGSDTFIFDRGVDRIVDFTDEADTLVLDTDLWGGGALSMQELGQYADVTGAGLVLDFGAGNVLTLTGLTSLDVLHNDLEFL